MTPNEARENIGTVMKDMDLDKQLVLERNVRKFLCMQMKVDVQWLKDNDIMDYSLLLGISYKNGYDPAHVKFLETPIKDIMKQLDTIAKKQFSYGSDWNHNTPKLNIQWRIFS